MKRLKPLLPTLKEKKRYLAFEIVSKDKITQVSEISRAIWAGTISFLGTSGAAKTGIRVLSETYNTQTQRGLIRVTHNGMNDIKASMTFIKQIENKPVILRSVGASGILAKAYKKYIEPQSGTGGTQW